jgi:hypothetical protein
MSTHFVIMPGNVVIVDVLCHRLAAVTVRRTPASVADMVFRFRPDADLVTDAPFVRRIQPFIMPTRNESIVYYDVDADADAVDDHVQELRARGVRATVLHVTMIAAVRALVARPRLNRFVAGGRLWQRRGIWLSYTVKTQKNDRGAVLAMKRRIDEHASDVDIVHAIEGGIGEARSGIATATEKELRLLLWLPTFILGALVRLLGVFDRFGLLPRFFIDGDPMFASMFFTNVGALGMNAPQHHLYEYGNIPLFCMIGAKRHAFFVDDGGVVRARWVYPLRFSFDERVEDAQYCLHGVQIMVQEMEKRVTKTASTSVSSSAPASREPLASSTSTD